MSVVEKLHYITEVFSLLGHLQLVLNTFILLQFKFVVLKRYPCTKEGMEEALKNTTFEVGIHSSRYAGLFTYYFSYFSTKTYFGHSL